MTLASIHGEPGFDRLMPYSPFAHSFEEHDSNNAVAIFHDTRHRFFPGRRGQQRVATNVATAELRERIQRSGQRAEAILRSLTFRAWALAVAEVRKAAAELAYASGVPLLRRSQHVVAVQRLLSRIEALQRKLCLAVSLSWWHHTIGRKPSSVRGAIEDFASSHCAGTSQPRHERKLSGSMFRRGAMREGLLVSKVLGVWRAWTVCALRPPEVPTSPWAVLQRRDEEMSARGCWPIEHDRVVKSFERKLGACHQHLCAFSASHDRLHLLHRGWQGWARVRRGAKRAQELHRMQVKLLRFHLPALCIKVWQAETQEQKGERHRRQRHRERADLVLDRAHAGQQLSLLLTFWVSWRRWTALRRAAQRAGRGWPVQRLDAQGELQVFTFHTRPAGLVGIEEEQTTLRLMQHVLAGWRHHRSKGMQAEYLHRKYAAGQQLQLLEKAFGAWHTLMRREAVRRQNVAMCFAGRSSRAQDVMRKGTFSSWRASSRWTARARRNVMRRLGQDDAVTKVYLFEVWKKICQETLSKKATSKLRLLSWWQRWKRRKLAYRFGERLGLLHEAEFHQRSTMRHEVAFVAWKQIARRVRDVTSSQLKHDMSHKGVLASTCFSAWALLHRRHHRRRNAASEKAIAALYAHQAHGLRTPVFHAWWSLILSRQNSFQQGQKRLRRWRVYKQHKGSSDFSMLTVTQVLAADEALGEGDRRRFLLTRCFEEWQREAMRRQLETWNWQRLDRRKHLLQQVAAKWASDQASVCLLATWSSWTTWARRSRANRLSDQCQREVMRAYQASDHGDQLRNAETEALWLETTFLHWHRLTSEPRRMQDLQTLRERNRRLRDARLHVGSHLVVAQEHKSCQFILQRFTAVWRGLAQSSREERRRFRSRQLASSLVDGSGHHADQHQLHSILQAWNCQVADSKAAAWARRAAHGKDSKAALALKVAKEGTRMFSVLILQGWCKAAKEQYWARRKAAAREVLALHIGRWGLRKLFDQWLDGMTFFASERMAHARGACQLHETRTRTAFAVKALVGRNVDQATRLALQTWWSVVHWLRLDKRRHAASGALAQSLDRAGLQRLLLSSWCQETAARKQERLQVMHSRTGSRGLAMGLSALLETSCNQVYSILLLQMCWQAWLCVATSGQAMSQALLQDTHQHSVHEQLSSVLHELALRQGELDQSTLRLRGGGRTVALCLAQNDYLKMRVSFDGWRRRTRGLITADRKIAGHLRQEDFTIIVFALKRWHALASARRRRVTCLRKAVYALNREKLGSLRIIFDAWRVLRTAGQASMARDCRRVAGCNAADRLVAQREVSLILTITDRWAGAARAKAMRRRSAKGATDLCQNVDKICRLAWLQALFTAWVDVLVIMQTAAIRLGIRQPASAATAMVGGGSSETAQGLVHKREAQFAEQLHQEFSHASRAEVTLAPLRLQHLTVQAVFGQWMGLVAQMHQARSLAELVEQRLDYAVARTCFLGWHKVLSKSRLAAATGNEKMRLNLSRQAFKRSFSSAAARTSDALSTLAATVAWKAWAVEAQRARARRLGAPEQLHFLQAITELLWSQDQRLELASHAVTAWKAGVLQNLLGNATVTNQTQNNTLRMASATLLSRASHLSQRGLAVQDATWTIRCLLAWREAVTMLRTALQRTASRCSAGLRMDILTATWEGSQGKMLQQLCLHGWHSEASSQRGTLHQTATLRSIKSKLLSVADVFSQKASCTSTTQLCYLHWHIQLVNSKRLHTEDELQMLVSLLHESTMTCRELRTQLLTQRARNSRMGKCLLVAVLHAWQQTMHAERMIGSSELREKSFAASATSTTSLLRNGVRR
eukprot:TRINITY_DN2232_c0_g1_i1.p1 TRINITY_DN2232_c0_g1~~TRINITY_DN2232_c0_g1_i1.p1  ORF type:complete len:1816 (-),score=292.73 TRINITY_DN2232_c0_g1_i1:39-5486(-)